MLKRDPSCIQTPLAAGPFVRIDKCGNCDVVSLHAGAVTLRLDASALESLHRTIGEALEVLHCSDPLRAMTPRARSVA
jgi:hypothetical protein